MEGCTNVGRTGWHIDGSFQERPFSHSIYHIIECPTDGATVFAPLNELIERLDEKKKAFWHRLYMASDRRGGVVQPHIYPHPLTKKLTLCFHLGMTDHYVIDAGSPEVYTYFFFFANIVLFSGKEVNFLELSKVQKSAREFSHGFSPLNT